MSVEIHRTLFVFDSDGDKLTVATHGNNLALRIAALDGRIEPFVTVGEQHSRFEDTLP